MLSKDKVETYIRATQKALFTTAVLFTSYASLAAAPSEAEWDQFNKATLAHHILPRYQALVESSQTLRQHASTYCAQPNTENQQHLATAFINTLQDWQSIQHINFGPVENNMYNFSMQYWPDKKNLTSKHLQALLTAKDPATLDVEYFRGASITVKGLPALERLIFDKKMADPFSCQLATAIAGNVAHMAEDIHHGWETFGKERFETALSGDDYYETAKEASTDLLKSLVEPIEVIRDLKLLRPMNTAVDKTKPRRAESWRSRQALDNLKSNLRAMDNLYQGKEGALNVKSLLAATSDEGQTLSQTISDDLSQAMTILDSIQSPLYEHLDEPANYNKLVALRTQLKTLHVNYDQAMALLNVQLGFNSRDGD